MAYTMDSSLDQQEVAAFVNRVVADTSGLAVTVMAALGDRFGLFKALAAAGPVSAASLAQRTGIALRYAQEWLNTMFSAGYLHYDPPSETFYLPAAHIPVLAEEGGPFFIGGTHQMLLGMMDALPALEGAFRSGAGIPMTEYDVHTWEGMERDMVGLYRANLVPHWIPALPEVQALLENGAEVADIGCGSGRCLILLAEAFPQMRGVGYDLFEPALLRAAANAAAAGVADRLRFSARDVSQGLPAQFDLIFTFDVVHDAADPLGLLRAIRRALRPGGRDVCLEIDCSERLEENTGPLAALRYGVSLLYCMSTSLAEQGAGLGTMGLPESKLRELCSEAGFTALRRVPLENAVHSLYEAVA